MNELIDKFEKMLGNGVGWVSEMLNDAINLHDKDQSPAGVVYRHFDKQAIDVGRKMQIVYAVNLFEAFMTDYIYQKEYNSSNSDIKSIIKSSHDKWNALPEVKNKTVNISTSFMNIQYSVFVLNDRYGLLTNCAIEPYLYELGALRNCLVHDNGDTNQKGIGGIPNKELFPITLAMVECVDGTISLDYEYVSKTVFGLQKIIGQCRTDD